VPFKVRFKLIDFMGDVEHFPCHFDYEIGDEFTYDGAKFEGRICHGVLVNMVPILRAVMFTGNRTVGGTIYRYSGLSIKDPGMKKYDGIGFRPLTKPAEGSNKKLLKYLPPEQPKEPVKGWGFSCVDSRTSAFFIAEPVDLASGGDSLPYYNREMNILEKIKKEPGMTSRQIMAGFTKWEREEIYPPLNLLNVPLMLDELAQVGYIELRNGKAYPGNPAK
jgi:uncharacterized repeat protein (TIGR04076 family)